MRVKIEIVGNEGGFVMDIPMSVEEISFEKFCEFRSKEREWWKYSEEVRGGKEEKEELNGEDEAVFYLKLQEMLEVVCGEGVRWLPVVIEGDNYQGLIDGKFRLRMGEEVTLLRLYAHLVGMIQDYVPDQIPVCFEWVDEKVEEYVIERGEAARVMFGTSVTAGEAITVLEYQRRAGMAERKELTDIGNIEFSLGVTEVAVLLRRRGEVLPASKEERDRFINRRRKVFEKMSLREVLDMRFFFINSLVDYGTTPNTSFFGMARLTPVEEREGR